MINKNNITGIILAGGKSSRMGTDKGFLLLNNKPFVQYSIDAITPLVSEIIIVSDNPNYDVFGLKRITDITKDSGPVAGIYSGLRASTTDYNIILSCDIPLISTEVIEKLLYQIDDNFEVIQVESDGKSMPLIAIYKKQVATIFETLLKQNEKRLRIAVNACKSKNVILESDYNVSTTNVNTPNEFENIKYANHH